MQHIGSLRYIQMLRYRCVKAVNCVNVIANLPRTMGSSVTVADTTTDALKIANGHSQSAMWRTFQISIG